MAPDPSVVDYTAWSELPTLASSGQLRLESGAAQRCAQYVEDMLELVVGVHTWIDRNAASASPTIAASVSGNLLWTVFNLKFGTELRERMDQHRDVLTDMGDTFVAAGKRYARTEHESTVSFEGISFDDPSGTSPIGAPKPVAVPNNPTKPGSTTTYDSLSFGPEMGAQLGWETLWIIGNSIDPQSVATAAGVWYWLSETLNTGFTTLRTNISAVSDQWEGAGSAAAISATSEYVTASVRLTGDMTLLGDSLLYTSGWLAQTRQNAMPPTPSPPPGDSISQQMANEVNLIRWQENFQTYYSDNYTHTLTRIVTLPQPQPVLTSSLDVGEYVEGVPVEALDPGQGNGPQSGPDDDIDDTPPTGDDNHGGGGDTPTAPGDDLGTGPANPHPETEPDLSNPSESLEENPFSTLSSLPDDLAADEFGNTPLLTNTALLPIGNAPLGGGVSKGFVGRGGPGTALTLEQLRHQESRLFPRAASVPDEKLPGRAGPVGGREPGVPFGGHPGRSNTDEKEKKRSELLDSPDNLDEALGQPGRGVRPVLDR
ncbi:hypothetical protein ACFYO7_29945 [Nocardia salmonicida]|uniref:hypothetical protein n=1 Tax=Nocardia salmonicida TaxID=53431 RepID=UPI0036953EA9